MDVAKASRKGNLLRILYRTHFHSPETRPFNGKHTESGTSERRINPKNRHGSQSTVNSVFLKRKNLLESLAGERKKRFKRIISERFVFRGTLKLNKTPVIRHYDI